jgi:broad specificity phosphatase PhoE
MKVYFVRHGESEANVLRVFSNRGWQHGLTETGIAQVEALSDRLVEAGIGRVYASPLKRAVQTAGILSQRLGVDCEVTDALREYDCGVIEGRGDEEAARVYSEVLDDWMLRHQFDSRIEEGESFDEMRARFVPFVERLVKASSDEARDLALVGHGGIFRCMLPLVLENVDFAFAMANRLGYASAVVARVAAGHLVCTDWGSAIPPDGGLGTPPDRTRTVRAS